MSRHKRVSRRPKGCGWVFLNGNSWTVRYSVRGRRVQRQGFPTKDLAEAFMAQTRTAIATETVLGVKTIEPKRFDEFVDEFMARAPRRYRESTVRTLRRLAVNIIRKEFGSRRLDDISRGDIEAFLARRAVGGAKAATTNRALSVLSVLFEDAKNLRFVRENPCAEIKRTKEPVRPGRFLSPAEQDLLLAKAHPRVQPIIMLALETGGRKGELLSLTWPQVDFERRVITFAVTKTGRPRQVPMTARAEFVLRALLAKRPPIPIDGPDRVLAAARIPPTWNGRFEAWWKDAADDAELPPMSFHQLRSVYACSMIAAGVTVPELQGLLGHSTGAMSLRYASAVPAGALERTRERLEAWRLAEMNAATKAAK
ncbi:MAG: site-specific integrase [Planctomycetes bacterium]|nr:site-specific integrase [Planctomycetota bacterium]MBI3843638.1 site-specific integrase [Planctomycetota bacterium]